MTEKLEINDFIKTSDNYGIISSIEKDIVKDRKGNKYDLTEEPVVIKYNKNDTPHDLLLKGLRAIMGQFTFRIQGTYITQIGFSGNPFFYGFTGKTDMHHLETQTLHHPEIHPTVIYYQAGNYADLMLENGKFEFDHIYDRQSNESYPNGTHMMGLVRYRDNKPRYAVWTYAGALYKLYILIMFGHTYYMFHGMSKKQIIDTLEIKDAKLGIKNPHYYQAFAHVCYYDEDIPQEYGLNDLKEKILMQFAWISELHHSL